MEKKLRKTRDKKSYNRSEESLSDDETEGLFPYQTETPSWSFLMKRYKRLWSSKIREDIFIKGIIGIVPFGLLLSPLYATLIGYHSVIGITVLFYFGCILGSLFSGYKYDIGFFGSSHVGILSSFLLCSSMFISILFSSISSAVFAIPILCLYMIVLPVIIGVYGEIGRSMREKEP